MFTNRWRIQGILTTTKPLHIGTGGVVTRDEPYLTKPDGERVAILAIATDASGRAYLPGSAIKGNLLEWLGGPTSAVHPQTRELFGTQELGGKLEFWDAPCTRPRAEYPDRAWCAHRQTAVAASVAIDRHTRTAEDKKLYHYEFVPPEVGFEVNVTGQNLTDEEVALIVMALENGFTGIPGGIALGACASGGWGRLRWGGTTIYCLDQNGALDWLRSNDPRTGWDALPRASAKIERRIRTIIQNMQRERARKPAEIVIGIELQFDGNFLVNDQSRIKPKRPSAADENKPNHAPLVDYNGNENSPLLPWKSFRGAFRSQAERIFRTMGGQGPDPNSKGILKVEEAQSLHLIEKLFGAPGWRSPVRFSDFTLAPNAGAQRAGRQEFVAIDRFTGGVAGSKKFNADSFWRPVLRGQMRIDLGALERCGAGPECLALLILTLRDLIEGDISFGFGSAKGYGTCKAKITSVTAPQWDRIPEGFRSGLSAELAPGNLLLRNLSSELRNAVRGWIERLQETLTQTTQ